MGICPGNSKPGSLPDDLIVSHKACSAVMGLMASLQADYMFFAPNINN
jgi:hypothetical protein